MSQSELERKAQVQKNLIATLLKFNIVSEFTEGGFASAVETILHKRVPPTGETARTSRRRRERAKK